MERSSSFDKHSLTGAGTVFPKGSMTNRMGATNRPDKKGGGDGDIATSEEWWFLFVVVL